MSAGLAASWSEVVAHTLAEGDLLGRMTHGLQLSAPSLAASQLPPGLARGRE
jgi:hypothetical protein